MTCKINADTTDGLKLISDTSGAVDIQDNGTTRVTVGDNIDIHGNELILDADGDTSIHASTDDEIDFKTGGTDRMAIDSSGRVTKSAQPAFSGYVTGTNNYSTIGVVAINNTAVNIGSHFDTSTDKFTAPVAGLYMISYEAHSENDSGAKLLHLYKNGSVLAHGSAYAQAGTYQQMGKTIVASLAANDYIQLYNAAGTFWGGDAQTGIGWDIYLLG